MLESRGWATRITDKYQLKRGDIVFTYESESSLPHVVIVCRDVTSDGNIYICGHTTNQRDVIRKASLSSIYYRIHDSFAMQSGDWR